MSLTSRKETLRVNPPFLLLQASIFIPAAAWMAPIIRQKKIDEGTLFSVLRLVVSWVLQLYATCSSRVEFQFVVPRSRRTFSLLLLLQKRPDVDEIGYKFICCFKRDIVLLLDKTNGQSYGSSGSCYLSELCVLCYRQEMYSRARESASIKVTKKRKIQRHKKKQQID